MPTVVTATEANRRFSTLLKQARTGEIIAITSHGEVVAYLVPRLAGFHDEREAREKSIEAALREIKSSIA